MCIYMCIYVCVMSICVCVCLCVLWVCLQMYMYVCCVCVYVCECTHVVFTEVHAQRPEEGTRSLALLITSYSFKHRTSLDLELGW